MTAQYEMTEKFGALAILAHRRVRWYRFELAVSLIKTFI